MVDGSGLSNTTGEPVNHARNSSQTNRQTFQMHITVTADASGDRVKIGVINLR